MNNIVLFGFMGCGKSTVGALLAQKSGRPLLDTDGYLEQKYGRTIPQIFATDGEEAFRQMERQVCRELAGRENRAGSVLRRRHRAEWGERRLSGPKRDNGVFGCAFYGLLRQDSGERPTAGTKKQQRGSTADF